MTKELGLTPIAVFYAYPSSPQSAADAAATAVTHLDRTKLASVLPWDKLMINGRPIPSEIFAAIDSADVLIGDLTGLNPNVLYEVGYAIGRGKRIWLTADLTRTSREAIAAGVPPLGTIGIYAYQNGHQLAASFEGELIAILEKTPLLSQFSAAATNGARGVLVMKALHDTDASVRVMERFSNTPVAVILDDPAETNARSLAWYIERLITSPGVLVHFTAADRTGASTVNARYAFVAGMARGLRANALLLQEKSTAPVPLDFREDVSMYGSGREATRAVGDWITLIETDQAQLIAKEEEDRERSVKRTSLQILYRGIGDFVAENDRDLISEYFLETAAYLNALETSGAIIFVGRKGTGKTANLLKLALKEAKS
ncbi:MAG: hypothetical protein ABI779_03415 [Acidobacteriota bacterium]